MLELAKLIHDAIGIESPRKFIALFAIAGFVLFGCLGWLVDKGYRAQLREQSTLPPSVNTTTGPLSPILPNNSGSVTITNQGTATSQPPAPKNKPK
jgi:hypothetical protein